MVRRLPSLNGLRAFETAARHGSFTKAAAELNVSHAAISRHIRELEGWLGKRLFRRLPRGVALTETGGRYSHHLTEIFDQLYAATEEALTGGQSLELKVSVEPSFAMGFLLKRLPAFQERHANIDLQVDPDPWWVDFRTDDADMAIRYGSGDWPDLQVTLLSRLITFPVCSPAVAAKLKTVADLSQVKLLHEERRQWWRDWLVDVGAQGVDAAKGPMMGDSFMCLEAARADQGVALGDNILVGDDLVSGRLVRLFTAIEDKNAVWLVAPLNRRETPAMKAFRDWVVAQIAPFRPKV
jgi:LysR family glycine cleavage system transcriptional activator|tara:strand:- start:1171 stop:2058 length:888 start_codon:yes stop_codon:yes gene_type:complete